MLPVHLKIAMLGLLPQSMRRSIMAKRYQAEIADTGEAELLELRNFLKRGDLAVDVGSNLGSYTYEMSRLTGNVAAFEPNPRLYNFVRKLGLPGVKMYRTVLSASDGTIALTIPQGHNGHQMASVLRDVAVRNGGDDVEEIDVPSTRLDSIGLEDVAFVKIDVEGFEEDVLEGAAETIARDRPILLIEIEERHNHGGLRRITDGLRSKGYASYFLRHSKWRPFSEFDLAIHQNADQEHVWQRRKFDYVNNFLFMPDQRAMEF